MKTYNLACRVCGNRWTQEFSFISCGQIRCQDGTNALDLPGYCPTGHTAQDVRDTWHNPRVRP